MKRIFFLFFLLASCIMSSQNSLWRSYYSYNNIVDISNSPNRIYAASENAVFSKSVLTDELKTITSVDGLKAETITAIYHSADFNKTLIGNDNGLLIIINADNTVLNVIDIIDETTITPNRKKINHIYEYEGKAYLSCDFGIAVFNLATMQFGDTYYMGPGGIEVPVTQSTVHEGYIYSTCREHGIRRAAINNPNLNDYNQWSSYIVGNWQHIASLGDKLVAGDNTFFYRINGEENYTLITLMNSPMADLRASSGYFIVTGRDYVKVYNNNLQQVMQMGPIPNELLNYTCSVILNDKLFIGTQEKGVFTTHLNNQMVIQNITPDGPLVSNIFALKKTPNFLWAVYGSYSYYYDPYPLKSYGISKLTPTGWITIPYSELFGAQSISDITANPNNENQVFASSYHSGLLKIENDSPVILYDQSNTGENGLESLFVGNDPSYLSVRVNSLAFDRSGNLWMTNSMIKKPLKVLRANGSWMSYNFETVVDNYQNEDYSEIVIDKNNTKWIATKESGLIAFNEGMNNKFIILKTEESNMPSYYVKALAIDNRNQLWIGTNKGLRVLPGVDRFLSEQELRTNSIIIMDDGLAQELMYEQFITDIAVDGANNKWIGTDGAGAFLVSPNGQQTLFHFTKSNSPLPSNSINAIEIDPVSGEVFFATNKGMVSYRGTSTKAEGNLNNVYVYPNPVRPGFEGQVNISGLMDKVNVKITDIEGNLVYETTSEGGTVLWDTRAFGKYKVASGVYMIFIASEDGAETKVKKVMIVR